MIAEIFIFWGGCAVITFIAGLIYEKATKRIYLKRYLKLNKKQKEKQKENGRSKGNAENRIDAGTSEAVDSGKPSSEGDVKPATGELFQERVADEPPGNDSGDKEPDKGNREAGRSTGKIINPFRRRKK